MRKRFTNIFFFTKTTTNQARNFSAKQSTTELQDIETRFGFNRPKKTNVITGTVKEYKKHIFVSSSQHFNEWPKDLSKEGTEFIVSLSKSVKELYSDQTKVTVFYEPDAKKELGTYIELFPEGILFPNLSVESIPKLLQFLSGNTKEGLISRPLSGNFMYVCSHSNRDMRCGYCGVFIQMNLSNISGPILIKSLEEKSKEIAPLQQISIRACSHVGGHEYAGNVISCRRISNSKAQNYSYAVDWFGYVAPEKVSDVIKFSHSVDLKAPPSESNVFPLWRGSIVV